MEGKCWDEEACDDSNTQYGHQKTDHIQSVDLGIGKYKIGVLECECIGRSSKVGQYVGGICPGSCLRKQFAGELCVSIGPRAICKRDQLKNSYYYQAAYYVEKDPDRWRWNIVGVSSIVLEVKVQKSNLVERS